MLTYEQMVERIFVAGNRAAGYHDNANHHMWNRAAIRAALDASGLWPVYEATESAQHILADFGDATVADWDEKPTTALSIRPVAQRRGLPELKDVANLAVGDFTVARECAETLRAALNAVEKNDDPA